MGIHIITNAKAYIYLFKYFKMYTKHNHCREGVYMQVNIMYILDLYVA